MEGNFGMLFRLKIIFRNSLSIIINKKELKLYLQLGVLRLDRPDPTEAYSVAANQRFDPSHRHLINDVDEKSHFRERVRVLNHFIA